MSQQQGYNNQPYQHANYPTFQQNNSMEYMQGEKYKEKSLIFGIVGIFFLGVVFGPLAIINANKAEAMHHSATPGKVLGWIATIWSAISIVIFIFIMIGLAAASTVQY
jgi:hypothetical protein